MTQEDYVTFEQAKALKNLDFSWVCNAYYIEYIDHQNKRHRDFRFNDVSNYILFAADFASAPTLSQAQKWLRKVKGTHIEVSFRLDGKWDCQIHNITNFYLMGVLYGIDTYEQALSAGIDQVLGIS